MTPVKESRLSLVFWLITLIGLPISFPYLIYEFIRTIREKEKRAALNNKVTCVIFSLKNVCYKVIKISLVLYVYTLYKYLRNTYMIQRICMDICFLI